MEDVEIQEWLSRWMPFWNPADLRWLRKSLERLRAHAPVNGIDLPFSANTPYANTIPAALAAPFSRRTRN